VFGTLVSNKEVLGEEKECAEVVCRCARSLYLDEYFKASAILTAAMVKLF
jgi:hypothetical protein